MDWYVVSEWRLLPVSRVADVISNCQFYRDERDELHRAADALCWLANLAEAGAPGLDLLRPDWSAHDTVQQLPSDDSPVVWRSIAEEAERSRVGDNSRLAESPSRDWFLSMSGIEQLGSNAGIGPEIRGVLLGLVPGAEARAHLREVQEQPEPDEKALALAMFFADSRKALTPQEQADQHRGWCDETMGAAHWFSLADVDPARAAMLLCQFNPNDITLAQAERQTNGETGPRDLVELRQRFEDLSRTEPGFRTLADWLGVARRLRLKHHSWIDTYVAAAGIQVAETLGEPPEVASVPTPATEPAPTGDVGLAGSGKPWKLKHVSRYPGYRKPLFDVLRVASVAGRKRPTAREVLEEWQLKRPLMVVRTTPDTIDYTDGKGTEKTADLKAIQQAINNLTE